MSKRLYGVLVLLGCVVAIPLSHLAISQDGGGGGGSTGDVAICHFEEPGADGIVLLVSEESVPFHRNAHNDCLDFSSSDGIKCRCNVSCADRCFRNGRTEQAACDGDQECLDRARTAVRVCVNACKAREK